MPPRHPRTPCFPGQTPLPLPPPRLPLLLLLLLPPPLLLLLLFSPALVVPSLDAPIPGAHRKKKKQMPTPAVRVKKQIGQPTTGFRETERRRTLKPTETTLLQKEKNVFRRSCPEIPPRWIVFLFEKFQEGGGFSFVFFSSCTPANTVNLF